MPDQAVYPLAGKVALSTGAGGDLGGSVAEVLAERAARVALLDVNGNRAEADTP